MIRYPMEEILLHEHPFRVGDSAIMKQHSYVIILTPGKEYKVLETASNSIKVILNTGDERWVNVGHFTPQPLEDILKNLLKII